MENERHCMTFADGSQVFHASGQIDDWCVWMRTPDGTVVAPRDKEYFRWFKTLAEKHGVNTAYNDFVKIYDATNKIFDKTVAPVIVDIANNYREDWLDAEKVFSILYMAMVSEFNYHNTKMNNKLKRLGIYQMLFEGFSPEEAAIFSRGKKVKELNRLCKERNF